jgi:Concanavalin A-like lectin/glucanases superfamily
MVCVLAIVLIAGVAEAQDITTGLIAHWKLDEVSGTTAFDSVGSNDGTLVGSPAWVPGAINFPVAGEVHHVDCGNDTSLDITGSGSVSAWVQVDSWNGDISWNRIVSKGGIEGGYELMRGTGADKNGIRFGVYASGAIPYVDGTVDVVTDGQWHLVTGVYDNPTGVVSLYIDGVLDNSATFDPDLTINPNDKPVYINGVVDADPAGKRHFDGRVDDVRFYNRVLTADDVAYMYSLPKPNIAPFVIVEDFESYMDTADLLTNWIDGGTNGTGADVVLDFQDYNRIMQLDYDNANPVTAGMYYSEVRYAVPHEIWDASETIVGLSLLFYGTVGNEEEPLYIGLEDVGSNFAFAKNGVDTTDTIDLTKEAWQELVIPLQFFTDAGVSLSNVTGLYIGLGDRDSHPTPGGAGRIRVGTIWLTHQRCVEQYRPISDLNGDCRVNLEDFAILASDWWWGIE